MRGSPSASADLHAQIFAYASASADLETLATDISLVGSNVTYSLVGVTVTCCLVGATVTCSSLGVPFEPAFVFPIF